MHLLESEAQRWDKFARDLWKPNARDLTHVLSEVTRKVDLKKPLTRETIDSMANSLVTLRTLLRKMESLMNDLENRRV